MTPKPDYERDGVTLYCGDCRDILPHLSGVDSIVTDPPYGLSYTSGHATDALWGERRDIESDADTGARDFVVEWSAGRPCLMFGTWRVSRPIATRQVLVWDKGGALGMGALDIPWKPDHEEIYVIGKGFVGKRDSGSVIQCPPVQSMAKNGRVHPTQKPVALMSRLIAKVPGVVCDPFMGSGSTGVACVINGRRFVGIESNRRHFDNAIGRIGVEVGQHRIFSALKKEVQVEMFGDAP